MMNIVYSKIRQD